MFKIGDKVKIIGCKIPVPIGFQDPGWINDMSRFIGMTFTILDIYDGKRYRLKDNSYIWSEAWIALDSNVEEDVEEKLLLLL